MTSGKKVGGPKTKTKFQKKKNFQASVGLLVDIFLTMMML